MGIEDRWTKPTGKVDSRGRPVRERGPRYGSGKRWLASWSDAGARRSLSFDTKDAAVAHLSNVVVDQRAGTYVTAHKQTLGEFGDQWIGDQIHQRDTTANEVKRRWTLHIKPALGHLLLTEITRQHVQSAVTTWATDGGANSRDRFAYNTVAGLYSTLATIMSAAAEDRLVRGTPCKRINLPNDDHDRVVPLTADQVHYIAGRVAPLYAGLVLLGAATGMRGGELRGLTTDRLRWSGDDLTIRIDRQLVNTTPRWGPPKTVSSDRVITVDQATAVMLREYMAAHPPHSTGLIFTGGRSKGPLARSSAANVWFRATAGMGLPERTGWHALRHFHASTLISHGVSVVAVAARLGHKDATETLSTYAHLMPLDEERSRDAIAAGLWAK